VTKVGKRWTWDTPSATQRRTTPRQRGANASKRARLAEIEATAIGGQHIVTNGAGLCHWCGFRIGPAGHEHCPDP
jgi:hypothetical protein